VSLPPVTASVTASSVGVNVLPPPLEPDAIEPIGITASAVVHLFTSIAS